MKKIYLLVSLIFISVSFAQLTEDFPGTGALTSNGWLSHNGIANQLTISTGSLTYAGITTTGNKVSLASTNTEDAHKVLSTSITGTAYFSAIVNFPNTTNLIAAAPGDYSISMGAGPTGATSAGALVGRIFYKAGVAPNTFNVGVLNNSGGTATPTYIATDFPINTPLFLVVKYVLATNTASLFLNPAIGTTEPAASVSNSTGTGAAPTQIANIALRQGGTGASTTGNVEYDAIRVANNWAFVTTSTLSRKNFDNISGLSIYPNPVTGKTFNVTSANNDDMSVVIYDVIGKQVLNTKVINNTVNVANLNAGIYIVKITEEGKTATRKLVIQ